MKYLRVKNEEEGKSISRELFNLVKPNPQPDDVTEFLFGVIEGKEKNWAIEVEETKELAIVSKEGLRGITKTLKPNASKKEEDDIISKVPISNKIIFLDILPPGITLDESFDRQKADPFPRIGKIKAFGQAVMVRAKKSPVVKWAIFMVLVLIVGFANTFNSIGNSYGILSTGFMSELILVSSDVSAKRTSVENNFRAYYNTY